MTMINLNLRNTNNIVTITIPGKTPLKTRSNGMFFWNSIELLEGSIGSCIGKIIIDYCRYNDIDCAIFNDVSVTKDDNFKVNIPYPKDLDKIHLERLKNQIITCPVTSLIKIPIDIIFIENDKLIKDIKIESKSCCGG